MGDPKNVKLPGSELKTRKPRESKPKTFGKLLGDTIDQLDALEPNQRGKLLAAVQMHYTNGTVREA
jgi:hypothetical protein